MSHLTSPRGITWHYESKGKGDTLLFIHGWGVDRRIWRQQIKHFQQTHHVLSVDLPGHGESSWADGSLQAMVEDLYVVLRKLGVRRTSVVGSSLGGLVGLKLYAHFADCIERLIFVGSMPKFARTDDYPHGLDVVKMRKLNQQLHSDYPSIVQVFFRSLFTREERQSRRYHWIQRFRRGNTAPVKEALLAYLDILEREDLREELKLVNCPIQFINGTGDSICHRGTVALLKTHAPTARFDDFDKCGHFPFLSEPYAFNQVLENFLLESKDGILC